MTTTRRGHGWGSPGLMLIEEVPDVRGGAGPGWDGGPITVRSNA